MGKMSHATREKIVEQVVVHTFRGRRKALQNLQYALADMIYNEAYSKKERDLIDSLSDAYVQSIDLLEIFYETDSGSKSALHVTAAGKGKRMPRGHNSKIRLMFDKETKCHKYILEYVRASSQLTKDEYALRKEAKAIVNSCSTDRRLIEVWPEVEQMVDPALLGKQPKDMLPAVNVSVINAVIQKELEKVDAD